MVAALAPAVEGLVVAVAGLVALDLTPGSAPGTDPPVVEVVIGASANDAKSRRALRCFERRRRKYAILRIGCQWMMSDGR